MDIYFVYTNAEGLKKRIEAQLVNTSSKSVPVYEKFDYLSPLDSEEKEARYLLVMNKEEGVLGVMKTKRYSLPSHEAVPEEKKEEIPNYIAISYVDVKRPFRRQGLATKLYECLNRAVRTDDKIVSSGLYSKEGKLADLTSVRKKAITRVMEYDSDIDCLADFYEENPDHPSASDFFEEHPQYL